eukprot:2230893-Rhodomonas_salina.2
MPARRGGAGSGHGPPNPKSTAAAPSAPNCFATDMRYSFPPTIKHSHPCAGPPPPGYSFKLPYSLRVTCTHSPDSVPVSPHAPSAGNFPASARYV